MGPNNSWSRELDPSDLKNDLLWRRPKIWVKGIVVPLKYNDSMHLGMKVTVRFFNAPPNRSRWPSDWYFNARESSSWTPSGEQCKVRNGSYSEEPWWTRSTAICFQASEIILRICGESPGTPRFSKKEQWGRYWIVIVWLHLHHPSTREHSKCPSTNKPFGVNQEH